MAVQLQVNVMLTDWQSSSLVDNLLNARAMAIQYTAHHAMQRHL